MLKKIFIFLIESWISNLFFRTDRNFLFRSLVGHFNQREWNGPLHLLYQRLMKLQWNHAEMGFWTSKCRASWNVKAIVCEVFFVCSTFCLIHCIYHDNTLNIKVKLFCISIILPLSKRMRRNTICTLGTMHQLEENHARDKGAQGLRQILNLDTVMWIWPLHRRLGNAMLQKCINNIKK